VSQRNKFKTNPDGSIDLYIQKDSRARQGAELAAGARRTNSC